MSKVAVVIGHPDSQSFNHALAHAYVEGAKRAGAEIKVLDLATLKFNPNLQFGYRKRTELEPDLLEAQEILKWASHIVWVYPIWWGSYPAVLKGFLDRVLLPGFAFKKREGSLWWDKFMGGKSSRIICTMDQPPWYYKIFNKGPSHTSMKKLTLQFIGIKKVRITGIGPIRLSTDEFRAKWLRKVELLGEKIA